MSNSITITGRAEESQIADEKATAPRLIMAFDCRRPLRLGARLSLDEVDEVLIGRGDERQWSRANRKLLIGLPDPEVSRLHVRLEAKGGGWGLHDCGSKNGTLIDGLRAARAALSDGDVITVGGHLLVYRDRVERTGVPGDRDLDAMDAAADAFRTLTCELERRADDLARIAPTSVPVLVTGETGTGKELVARAVHDMSARSGAFVPINCGALPVALVESELFGHRRGAFSGAQEDRVGLARKADRGTLFLDEVAELPDESQVALLRLLQEGEVRPIGSSETFRVDVRVIAATHQDVLGRIEQGRFRRDLYARLAGYEMAIPPLRDRREDIGSLIAVLLARLGAPAKGCSIQPRAAAALFGHSYPMNVRELEQALAAALALAPDGSIGLEHLPPAIRTAASNRSQFGPEDAALRDELVDLLRQSGGNISATARALARSPVQIRRWCRRLRIDAAEFRR